MCWGRYYLFSDYIAVGKHKSNFDVKVEALSMVLQHLIWRRTFFSNGNPFDWLKVNCWSSSVLSSIEHEEARVHLDHKHSGKLFSMYIKNKRGVYFVMRVEKLFINIVNRLCLKTEKNNSWVNDLLQYRKAIERKLL